MTHLTTTLALLLAVLLCLASLPALAANHPKVAAGGPQAIGTWQDWTAATNREAGQTVCYAFARARTSAPKLAGRGDVVLTVTERPALRDAVALSSGFAYPANAAVKVTVGAAAFEFYTAQRSAFARDGKAVVQALARGREATATSPAPKDGSVTDTFPLRGFPQAYAAILKHCPAGKG